MNADFNSSMTQWDRYNLVLPDRVVNQIISQCRFPEHQMVDLKVEPEGMNRDFQEQFIEESSCIVCKQIPINAKECAYCNKLICFLCEIRSAFNSDGQRIQQRQCHSCNIVEARNITQILDDNPLDKFEGITVHGFNGNPGPTLLQPLFRTIQNKLMKQMLGQIKVKHRCQEEQDYQHVLLADLDKHVVNKCQGFKIFCYACNQPIKTIKGLYNHIKYQCPEVQIQCYFCTESFTRSSFKDVSVHPCRLQLDQIFHKLRGKPDGRANQSAIMQLETVYIKHISESSRQSERDDAIGNYVNALKDENEHFKKTTIDSSLLPMASQLLCIKQMNSLVNFKLCINPVCAQNYRIQGSGYRCHESMQLVKDDNEEMTMCQKCSHNRRCRIYQCQDCQSVFCYYCLVEEQRKVFVGLVDENFDPNDISVDQNIFANESLNDSQIVTDLVPPKTRAEELADKTYQKDQLVKECFGKYADQYMLFEKWSIPIDYFTVQQQWVSKFNKVESFDFLQNSKHAVKPNSVVGPDRLELELVSIKKQNNFVYEGQVLTKNQVFHGFGRLLQYQGGPNSGNCYVYEGWFINGLPHGYGRKVNEDGIRYEGNFLFGLENGVGCPTNSYLN